MKFGKLEIGHPLLYLPEISDRIGPRKVYFLYKTEDYDSKSVSAKIITTTSQEAISNLPNIATFREEQRSNIDFNIDSKYILVFDFNSIHKYSESSLRRYIVLYDFSLRRESIYKRLEKWAKPFSEDDPTLFYSKFVGRLKKVKFFGRSRFYIRCAYLGIKGILKYLAYPFIFLFDLLVLTFDTYSKYRKSISERRQYSKKSMRSKMAYLGLGEKAFNEERAKKDAALDQAKTKYLNTNIAFLTLIIALLGLIASQIIDALDNSSSKAILEVKNAKVEQLQDEIQALKAKTLSLDILKIENRVLAIENDSLRNKLSTK